MSKCVDCLYWIQGPSSVICAHPKGNEQYRYYTDECNIFGDLRDGFEKTELLTHEGRAHEIGWIRCERFDEMANGEIHKLVYYKKP